MQTNVLGTPLEICSLDPLTGFSREGSCSAAAEDFGRHVVCAQVTEEFLQFSLAIGNDLITPMPLVDFPGLQPGDRWCVCAARWQEALSYGMAPPVVLTATHSSALEVIGFEDLLAHSHHDSEC